MRFGMQMTTRVEKKELLEILRKNREQHKKIWEEALEGYRVEMVKRLDRFLVEVKEGKLISQQIGLPVPTNETGSYDTAIKMLEMGTDTIIILSAQDFACLVEDKWEWKRNFILSNSGYSGTAQVLAAQMGDDE